MKKEFIIEKDAPYKPWRLITLDIDPDTGARSVYDVRETSTMGFLPKEIDDINDIVRVNLYNTAERSPWLRAIERALKAEQKVKDYRATILDLGKAFQVRNEAEDYIIKLAEKIDDEDDIN